MPHSHHRSRSKSLSPLASRELSRKEEEEEEELDEFGRVKQRRTKFTTTYDGETRHRRYHKDDDSDNESENEDHDDKRHHRRHYHRSQRHRSPSHHRDYSDNDQYESDSDDHRRHSPRRRYHDQKYHHRRNSDMDEYNHKKIYIGDLADITSSELEKVFSKFGVITHIKLIEGKEYGFITFERSSSAQEAISAMDGTLIRDHKIKVNRAKMMDRSRHGSGNSSWMDEDGSIRTEAPRYTFPTPQVPDHPPRTLTSYDDLL